MPRTRSPRTEDTARTILRAALSVFSEHGFDGASTRNIANAAGVDHGLVRYHFGTKEKLWQAAVEQAFRGLEEAVAEPAPELMPDERARIRHMAREYIRYVASNPDFVRLMTNEGKRRGPRMRWIVDQHVKRQYALIEVILDRCKRLGMTPENIEPMSFVYSFMGASVMIFHQAQECRRVFGIDPTTLEIADQHADAIEALFFPGSAEDRTHGP